MLLGTLIASMAAASFAATTLPEPPNSTVPKSRLRSLSQGANICRWFRFPNSVEESHWEGYMTDAEMRLMRRIGLRHVRLCVAPRVMMDEATGEPIPERWAYVEKAITRLLKADLAVMIDMHNEEHAKIADDLKWRESFLHFWEVVAKKMSTRDPERVFLEIVNEPVFDGKEAEWYAFQETLAATIRKQAPTHTIIATGANWGGIWGLQKLQPLKDPNVVYSFHNYDPFPFTHQGATWTNDAVKPLKAVPYPSSPEAVAPLMVGLPTESQNMLRGYGEERWDRKRMTSNFKVAIDWGVKHGVPLYCGEFGVYPVTSTPEPRANWFRDFGGVLAENGVGWAVWGWDEGFGLDRKKEGTKISYDPVVAAALGLKVR